LVSISSAEVELPAPTAPKPAPLKSNPMIDPGLLLRSTVPGSSTVFKNPGGGTRKSDPTSVEKPTKEEEETVIRPSGLGPLLVIWISHVRCPAPKTLVVLKTASMKLPVKSLEPREEVKVPVAEATRGAVGTLSPRGQAALNPRAQGC